MQRASYANQARVHHGYHYPRSVLTALRSKVNFPLFAKEYRDCICDDFQALYAVARQSSKVTSKQFMQFCNLIGSPVKEVGNENKRLFNNNLVENVFEVVEYAFDTEKLKRNVLEKLSENNVKVMLDVEALEIYRDTDSKLYVRCNNTAESLVSSLHVYNCTYSRINQLLINSKLPVIPLKHELTEMPLINLPDEIQNKAITVMCGPFFSVMPFPARQLHTISHVRYTPHNEWFDGEGVFYNDAYNQIESFKKTTNYPWMIKDAQRYVPCLSECQYVDSLWEVKTVLPSTEIDDSRPILYAKDHGIKGLTCIMGGKIDNIFDMTDMQSNYYY